MEVFCIVIQTPVMLSAPDVSRCGGCKWCLQDELDLGFRDVHSDNRRSHPGVGRVRYIRYWRYEGGRHHGGLGGWQRNRTYTGGWYGWAWWHSAWLSIHVHMYSQVPDILHYSRYSWVITIRKLHIMYKIRWWICMNIRWWIYIYISLCVYIYTYICIYDYYDITYNA